MFVPVAFIEEKVQRDYKWNQPMTYTYLANTMFNLSYDINLAFHVTE